MQPSELRAAMRRRRSEWKLALPRIRQLARVRLARLGDLPVFKAAREAIARRRRRRRRTAAAIAIALLALLLIDCEGKPGRGTIVAKATPIASVRPTPKPTPPGPLHARLEPQKRPGYTLDARPGPDWLDDFRLQVAARSPRLSACFNGSERGGTHRWTVSIDAKTGAATGHDFEPLGSSAQLTIGQKACAMRTLSDPDYLLKDPPADALPNRVSLILEF